MIEVGRKSELFTYTAGICDTGAFAAGFDTFRYCYRTSETKMLNSSTFSELEPKVAKGPECWFSITVLPWQVVYTQCTSFILLIFYRQNFCILSNSYLLNPVAAEVAHTNITLPFTATAEVVTTVTSTAQCFWVLRYFTVLDFRFYNPFINSKWFILHLLNIKNKSWITVPDKI